MSLPPYGMSGSDLGATPLEPDESRWLVEGIDPGISLGELNALEEENIEVAYRSIGRRIVEAELQSDDLLDDHFLRETHRSMFCEVWQWAGRYRWTELSIGVDPAEVSVQTRSLLDDARTWLEYETYPVQESAVRLSHGITRIHPFKNGNGRLSRLFLDLLELSLDVDLGLDWGAGLGLPYQAEKWSYIRALQAADGGDIHPLLRFATSCP